MFQVDANIVLRAIFGNLRKLNDSLTEKGNLSMSEWVGMILKLFIT
jgi:hypothetical protein